MSKFNYYYDDGSNRRRRSSSTWRVVLGFGLLVLVVGGILFYFKHDRNAAKPKVEGKSVPETAQSAPKEPEKLAVPALPAVPEQPAEKKKPDLPDVPLPVAELEAKARALLTEGNPVAARDLVLPAVAKCEFASPEFRRLGALLREANLIIINRAVPCPQVIRYSVKNGDSLYNIARDYKLPMEMLRRSNQLSDGNAMIRPGQVLKIYKGDWKIKVSKKATLLCVYDGDNLFSIYDIGIGREGRTPTGEFQIEDKIKNPPWYSPDGRIVPFGDKENVLGTRWLKLKPVGDTDPYQLGYGIHGTWDEGSITRPLSNGCVRMRNADVEELYDYIPRQTPVTISE